MTDTELKTIVFKPGIDKDTTKYGAEGGWIDCDKVRFREDRAEKIGGWSPAVVQQNNDSNVTSFTGAPRDMLSWNDLQFNKYIAAATNEKIELVFGNIIFDITPVREQNSIENAISTTNGSSTVKITDNEAHSLVVDDYVFVNDQETAVDGITLSGEYQVTNVISPTEFEIDAGTNATGTTNGGGDTLDIDYLLPAGPVSNGALTGWSGGTWNTPGASGQGWNRPRDSVGGLSLRQWSLDTWGEDLLACQREGKIYVWDATNGVGSRLQELSNAPDQNLFMLVAQPSRQVVAFGSEVEATGTFDPLIVRWSDIEDRNTWTTSDTNSAGEFRLSGGNTIRGAVRTRSEIIIFTDTDVYAMRFVGGNQVFEFEPLGTNVSAASQHSSVDVNGTVFWMGTEDFYMYDGVVKTLPSRINKFIFDQDGEGKVNPRQKEKIYASL